MGVRGNALIKSVCLLLFISFLSWDRNTPTGPFSSQSHSSPDLDIYAPMSPSDGGQPLVFPVSLLPRTRSLMSPSLPQTGGCSCSINLAACGFGFLKTRNCYSMSVLTSPSARCLLNNYLITGVRVRRLQQLAAEESIYLRSVSPLARARMHTGYRLLVPAELGSPPGHAGRSCPLSPACSAVRPPARTDALWSRGISAESCKQ